MKRTKYLKIGFWILAGLAFSLSLAYAANLMPGSGSSGSGEGSSVWGTITGTLAGQADLQNALNAKLATSHISDYNHALLHSNSFDHSNALDHSHANKSILDTYDQSNANITDAISKKHSNSLDHSNALDHAHTNGTILANIEFAFTTALKGYYDTAYTHSQAAHAPSNAQKNSDITKAEIEAKLTGELTSHTHAESSIANLTTDLGNKVTANGTITGAVKTKLTYDAKGLVTAGADATTADIADSADKRYCTDAQKTIIGNTSGTNSGDSSGHAALALLDNPAFTTKITTPAITLGATVLTSTGTELNLLHGITVLSGSNTGDGAANSSTMYIGTTATALNRASAAQTLAGITLTTPVLGAATGTSLAATGAITSSGAGIGYATGAGGTVTQATSRATGVTLSKPCGTITMFSAAVAAQGVSTFTLTNTFIAATDFVLIQHISTTNGGAWQFSVVAAAGSAAITVRNVSTASITEATPLRFVIIKATTS